MTEAHVVAITGPCETSSETNTAGYTSKSLDCKGAERYSGAILLFSNGKLASKSQFGLANSSTEVKGSMTLAKFNQLKVRQTSAAVQVITGPCEKSSETKTSQVTQALPGPVTQATGLVTPSSYSSMAHCPASLSLD